MLKKIGPDTGYDAIALPDGNESGVEGVPAGLVSRVALRLERARGQEPGSLFDPHLGAAAQSGAFHDRSDLLHGKIGRSLDHVGVAGVLDGPLQIQFAVAVTAGTAYSGVAYDGIPRALDDRGGIVTVVEQRQRHQDLHDGSRRVDSLHGPVEQGMFLVVGEFGVVGVVALGLGTKNISVFHFRLVLS